MEFRNYARPNPRPHPEYRPAVTTAATPPEAAQLPQSTSLPEAVPAPRPASPTEHIPPPVTQAKERRRGNKLFPLLLFLVLAAVCAGGVYFWQSKKVTNLKGQVTTLYAQAANLSGQLKDQQAALAALPNIVVGSSGDSADLVVFLGSDNTQCYKQPADGKGYYNIDKEVNDQFAEIQYGCEKTYAAATPAYILATKASGQWQLISPTNQWLTVDGLQYPSCTMVNDNKVSKQLEPKCAVPAADSTAQPTTQAVTNP